MSSITIVSDAPNCGITYDRKSDDRNSFIIQASGLNYVLVESHFGQSEVAEALTFLS